MSGKYGNTTYVLYDVYMRSGCGMCALNALDPVGRRVGLRLLLVFIFSAVATAHAISSKEERKKNENEPDPTGGGGAATQPLISR